VNGNPDYPFRVNDDTIFGFVTANNTGPEHFYVRIVV
jgi:hypothetical protein